MTDADAPGTLGDPSFVGRLAEDHTLEPEKENTEGTRAKGWRGLFVLRKRGLKILIGLCLVFSMLHVLTTSYKYALFVPNILLCVVYIFAVMPSNRLTRWCFMLLATLLAVIYIAIAVFVLITMGSPGGLIAGWLIDANPTTVAIGGFLQAIVLIFCTLATLRLALIYRKERQQRLEKQPLLDDEEIPERDEGIA